MFCDLHGRTALVTGSSRGIGFALARGLARQGAKVFLHGASDSPKLREAVAALKDEGLAADAVVGDLADPAAPEAIARQVGPDGVGEFFERQIHGFDFAFDNRAAADRFAAPDDRKRFAETG